MSPDGTMLSAYRRVFANSRLARLLAGEFISSIGDWLYLVALLIVVYQESHDALALGLVGAGRIAPYLIFAVPAGIAADRFDRRLILLTTDIIRGVLQVVLAILVFVSAPTLAIVGVAILAASASAFFGPAIGAYLPSLVEDEADLGPANSAWATLDHLAFFVGPAIAGILIATGGLVGAFLLNAASFAVVAVILATLPGRASVTEEAEPAPAAGGAQDGAPAPAGAWRSIIDRLPGIIVLDAATSFVGSGLGVLTVVVAVDSLGAGEAGTGYLNAAIGIGGVLAGIVAGWVVLRRLDAGIVGASVVCGVGLVALASTRDLAPALVAIGVAVGALLLLDVINETILQRTVPDAERGRAMGVLQVPSAAAAIIGAFVAPVLADLYGVAAALIAIGVLATLIGAASVLLLRPTGALAPSRLDPRRLEVLRTGGFAGLLPARLETAARRLVPLDVRAGEPVIDQGGTADHAYFIDSGRFKVEQRSAGGDVTELRTMGPGEMFGEIGLLRSEPRTATVTAESDGRLFVLDREGFLGLVNAGPGLTTQLLDRYRRAATAYG
jgi:MFS family permease